MCCREEAAVAKAKAEKDASRLEQGLPVHDFAEAVPPGARCCDEMCFGEGVYERVYLALHAKQEKGSRGEREALLGSSVPPAGSGPVISSLS